MLNTQFCDVGDIRIRTWDKGKIARPRKIGSHPVLIE
jgi:hypothetical protein